MTRLFLSPEFQATWKKFALNTVADAVAKLLPQYQQRRKVTVQRVTLSDGTQTIDAFFKLYHHREGGWRFWLRSSKAKIEFDNYLTFQRLGVSAAQPIACCEERDVFGRLHRDFILTRAVPDALGLDEFFRRGRSRAERQAILRELANLLRRLHNADFFYNDLVWRNILVSETSAGPRLFLIDCPRGGIAHLARRRKVLRDLASLDKTAAQLCSRAERMRFFLQYLGQKSLDDVGRKLASACLHYRRTRWPEDWLGK